MSSWIIFTLPLHYLLSYTTWDLRHVGQLGKIGEALQILLKQYLYQKVIFSLLPTHLLTSLLAGEVYSEKIENDTIICLKWQDKREVNMLSTFHSDDMVEVRRRTRSVANGVNKPIMIHSYNQHMGGVDKSDQLILYYGFPHRSIKWWKRVFFHLLDLSVVNASILYNIASPKPLSQLEFRLALVAGLLKNHRPAHIDRRHLVPTSQLPLRLTERAFPEPIPTDTPYGGRPQCEVCRAKKIKRSQTQYRCKFCLTPLHSYPCFEVYHTKLHYNWLLLDSYII